jgi:class 3 adenylate cyclase
MELLNNLYYRFDKLTERYKVYKVETIGDCYMVAAGLLHAHANHAKVMLDFALHMQHQAGKVMMPNGQPVKLRIGVNSGRVMSGVVGKIRRRYCLFGDCVNTASRMESTADTGKIQVGGWAGGWGWVGMVGVVHQPLP